VLLGIAGHDGAEEPADIRAVQSGGAVLGEEKAFRKRERKEKAFFFFFN
jgi:hypothetical protein